ncbi:hypothetical protein ACQBAT_00435 [Ornithinimicrobium sp. Y1847]|uniref:hypothetical protein n=1 Tax=Ornithinimicrobium sp. Y1847 TaxID=3405419 RepID=UPI003B680BCD
MKSYIYLKSLANRREAGQGSLEYLGVIIVAVMIVGLLIGAANGWGGSVRDAFQTAIEKVTSKA